MDSCEIDEQNAIRQALHSQLRAIRLFDQPQQKVVLLKQHEHYAICYEVN